MVGELELYEDVEVDVDVAVVDVVAAAAVMDDDDVDVIGVGGHCCLMEVLGKSDYFSVNSVGQRSSKVFLLHQCECCHHCQYLVLRRYL